MRILSLGIRGQVDGYHVDEVARLVHWHDTVGTNTRRDR